ncbi:MAG: hypothetical protein MJ252_18150, partial [archaeon]|nr:hypothetical protein [archaeon]
MYSTSKSRDFQMPPIVIQTQANTLRKSTNKSVSLNQFFNKYKSEPENRKTTQSQTQKESVFAQGIDKEELYEKGLHLQKENTKLKLELAEVRSTLEKSELNVRKKERIIEELSKEVPQDNPNKDPDKQEKFSALPSLVEKNYKTLKGEFKKKQEENEKLKAELIITKKKETRVEALVFTEELNKLRNLYNQAMEINTNSTNEIGELEEIKKKYYLQNKIIASLEEESDNNAKEKQNLSDQIEALTQKLNKKDDELNKAKKYHEDLQNMNETLQGEKKKREKYSMTYAEYMQRLKTAEDQIKKVKFDQKKLEKEIKYQKDLIEDINKKLGKEDPLLAQQRFATGGGGEQTKKPNRFEEMEEKLKDLHKKCEIYEKYINKKKNDPIKVNKDAGYDDVVNEDIMKKVKEIEKQIEQEKAKNKKNEENKPEEEKKEENKPEEERKEENKEENKEEEPVSAIEIHNEEGEGEAEENKPEEQNKPEEVPNQDIENKEEDQPKAEENKEDDGIKIEDNPDEGNKEDENKDLENKEEADENKED